MLQHSLRLAAAGLIATLSLAPSFAAPTRYRWVPHHHYAGRMVHHHYRGHYYAGAPYYPGGPYVQGPSGTSCVPCSVRDLVPCDPPSYKAMDGRCNTLW